MSRIFLLLFWVTAVSPVQLGAQWCGRICDAPGILVREDAGSVEITVTRVSKFNEAFKITYGTADDSSLFPEDPFAAKAGEDYVETRGEATFAVWQTNLTLRIPILNNNIVNERRVFEFYSHSPDQSVVPSTFHLIEIEDDESPTAALEVDPSFVSEVQPNLWEGPVILGNSLWVHAGSFGTPGMVKLRADGTLDSSFRRPLEYTLVAEFSDGRMWAKKSSDDSARDYAFLSPDFSVQSSFHSVLPIVLFPTAQPDGKLLCLTYLTNVWPLARFELDGTLDKSFQPVQITNWGGAIQAHVLSNNKILLSGADIVERKAGQRLVRLNADGTIDPDFTEVGYVDRAFPLRSGKILASQDGGQTLVRLNEDGSFDQTFTPLSGSSLLGQAIYELDDGKVLMATAEIATTAAAGLPESNFRFRNLVLIQLDTDGAIEKVIGRIDYTSLAQTGMGEPQTTVKFTKDGALFFSSLFDRINGYPRSGIARFFARETGRKFFVQPQSLLKGGQAIGLRIRRTGETSTAGSVKLETRDGSAIENRDYFAVRGALDFEPGEGCKDLVVTLNPKRARDALTFWIVLSEPSEPYSATPATSVRIPRPLSIDLHPGAELGTGFFMVRGVPPESRIKIQATENLRDWFELWLDDAWAHISVRAPAETVFGRPVWVDSRGMFFRASNE